MKWFYFILAGVLMPCGALAAEPVSLHVTHAISGKSLQLESGDLVRLASIEAPNVQDGKRPGEPLGDEAKAALAALAEGQTIRIDYAPTPRDRHNRLLGQVYLQDGQWLQQLMLERGLAMVYSFNDDAPELLARMFAAEQKARAAKLGIWANPYWRMVSPQEAGDFINRYKIVEGRIISVNHSRGNIYVNFSKEWKGQFAVFIPRKFAGDFDDARMQAWVGKMVRVRGWIHYHNAPMIDVTTPGQIEVE